mmetsp:Transcript_23865/g.40692  ORF Transcript_23865/g.40692 Transcript_23865/m.40692 type:complete len:306 (+) Transcript_23865:100-1017(+)
MASPPPPPIDTSPILKGRVSITPNLLSKQQVEALLDDAKHLHRKGVFVPGGLRRRKNTDAHLKQSNDTSADDMRTTTDATTRICDICGIFDDAEAAGPSDARDDLLDLMGDLRELLQTDLGVRLSESMELQYLRYPGGDGSSKKKKSGFYGRHFDSSPEDEKTCRRKVSLLLYLNDETWDVKRDGGVLRAYLPRQQLLQQESKSVKKRKRNSDGLVEEGGGTQDITPKGGTLVLFDSASVEHEVLPTYRERWAVVGWFLEEDMPTVDRRKNHRLEGQKRSSQPSHHSGEDQQRRKKKKKRRRRGG